MKIMLNDLYPAIWYEKASRPVQDCISEIYGANRSLGLLVLSQCLIHLDS